MAMTTKLAMAMACCALAAAFHGKAAPAESPAAALPRIRLSETQEDHIANLKRWRLVPEWREFDVSSFSAPTAIPFERLSAAEAKRSRRWYSEASVGLSIDAKSVAYYNDEIYPAAVGFFGKIASSSNAATVNAAIVSAKVRRGSADAMRKCGSEKAGNEGLLLAIADAIKPMTSGTGCKVAVVRPKATDFSTLKVGLPLPCDVVVFTIPEAYMASVVAPRPSFGNVVMELKDANGNLVGTQKQDVEIGPLFAVTTDKTKILFLGFGMDVAMNGDVYLTRTIPFKRFPVFGNGDSDEISFEAHWESPQELQRKADAAREQELAEKQRPGFFTYVAIAVWLMFLGMLFYMLWILYKERRRRFAPLTASENGMAGMAGASLASYAAGPEDAEKVFAEAKAHMEGLEHKDVNGESRALYTRRTEVDAGYALLARLVALPKKTAEQIEWINGFGNDLNAAQRRYRFGGKKVIHWVVGLAFCLLTLCSIVEFLAAAHSSIAGNGDFWERVFETIEGRFCIATYTGVYFLTILRPAYKFVNPDPGYQKALNSICTSLRLGAVVTATAPITDDKYITVYRDAHGNLYRKEDTPEETVSKWGVAIVIRMLRLIVAYFMFVFAFLLNCITNFVRNYIGDR